jgi:hypothetical protein
MCSYSADFVSFDRGLIAIAQPVNKLNLNDENTVVRYQNKNLHSVIFPFAS